MHKVLYKVRSVGNLVLRVFSLSKLSLPHTKQSWINVQYYKKKLRH